MNMGKLMACFPLLLACSVGFADQYSDEGTRLGNAGMNSAAGVINDNSGQTVVPSFSHNAPEEAYYHDGSGMIGSDGTRKTVRCANQAGGTQSEQIECDAINFMNKNPNQRPLYGLNPDKDPIFKDADAIKKNSIVASQGSGNKCFVQEKKIPAQFKTEQCIQTRKYTEQTCQKSSELVCGKDPNNSECGGVGGVKNETILNTVVNSSWYTFRNSNLSFELQGGGGTGIRQAEFTFEIDDVSQTDLFELQGYYKDDGIQFHLNGHEIINSSWGSEGNAWVDQKMDLRQYLVSGVNTVILKNKNERKNFRSSVSIFTKSSCRCNTVKSNSCVEYENPDKSRCEKISDTCTQLGDVNHPECKVAALKFQCLMDTQVSDCNNLMSQGCTQLSSTCLSKDSNGQCLSFSKNYQCQTDSAQQISETICVDTKCTDGNCFPETSEDDTDFAKSVAMMEAGREAGVYGTENTNLNIFKGTRDICTVKLLGGHNIMSCCLETTLNKQGNNNSTGSTATQAFGNTPEQIKQSTSGSSYQYDDLYNKDKVIQQLQSTLTGGWLQCEQTERELTIKRATSLCEYTDSWCSNKVLGSCTEESRSFCCFKSILAKSINRQGKQQLGLDQKDCNGFNQEQINKLDFSAMDLTEFMNSILPKEMDVEARKSAVKQQIDRQAQVGYYGE